MGCLRSASVTTEAICVLESFCMGEPGLDLENRLGVARELARGVTRRTASKLAGYTMVFLYLRLLRRITRAAPSVASAKVAGSGTSVPRAGDEGSASPGSAAALKLVATK